MRKASWDVESNNSKGFAMERAAGVKEGGEISPLSQVNKGVKRKSEFQTVYCSVCKVFLNSSSQAAAHYSGKSHQNKVRSQSSLDGGSSALDTSTPVPDPVQESFRCDLCQRTFNSESQMKAHLAGRAHQLLVKRKIESSGILSSAAGTDNAISPDETTAESSVGATSEQTGPPASLGTNLTKVYHCAKCNITLNSQKQLEQHNRGLRHKIVIGKAKPPPVNGEKWENVRFMKIANAVLGMNKDTAPGSGGGMNLKQFHCEKCNITVNSQIQLNQHLKSQKHKMKGTEPSLVRNTRRRGGASRGGRAAGQDYQRNNKQASYGGRHQDYGHFIPPLSMNFVPSDEPYLGSGSEYRDQLHLMKPCGPEDVSQNWNSNFIYDMPSRNLALF